jgi:serine/threonine protein kinase
MGSVYLAKDERLGRSVAIKLIKHSGRNPEASGRFVREARAVAGLSHPNIVAIYDIGKQPDGTLYTALEFVEGGTLRTKMSGQPLPLREAVELMIRVARAVHAAHERGIVHRDLKPSNILLTKEGVPKITDFGLAKLLDEPSDDVDRTTSGTILGTPAYMAPEQAMGQIDLIGPASDIFSLGGILYELLTSHRPFAGRTVMAMLHQVLNQTPDPPSRLRADVPRPLDAICLKCLDKEPERRYPSAAALAEDLERFLIGEPVKESPPPRRPGLWRRLFPG